MDQINIVKDPETSQIIKLHILYLENYKNLSSKEKEYFFNYLQQITVSPLIKYEHESSTDKVAAYT